MKSKLGGLILYDGDNPIRIGFNNIRLFANSHKCKEIEVLDMIESIVEKIWTEGPYQADYDDIDIIFTRSKQGGTND